MDIPEEEPASPAHFMDTLRVEEEGKEREVNHHGKTITVGLNNSVAPSTGAKKVIGLKGMEKLSINTT